MTIEFSPKELRDLYSACYDAKEMIASKLENYDDYTDSEIEEMENLIERYECLSKKIGPIAYAGANNEAEILNEALTAYQQKLENDVASTNDGKGWPEINAEIETVKSLIERL